MNKPIRSFNQKQTFAYYRLATIALSLAAGEDREREQAWEWGRVIVQSEGLMRRATHACARALKCATLITHHPFPVITRTRDTNWILGEQVAYVQTEAGVKNSSAEQEGRHWFSPSGHTLPLSRKTETICARYVIINRCDWKLGYFELICGCRARFT